MTTRVETGDVAECFLQHVHDARGRTRNEFGAAAQQKSRIGRRQRIDVFRGIERVENGRFAHLRRKRHLHENAVHFGIAIERLHLRQNIGFAGAPRHGHVNGVIAQIARRLTLVADIDFAGRIVAHENGRKPRHEIVLALQPRGFRDHPLPQLRRKCLAVDDLSRHAAGASK